MDDLSVEQSVKTIANHLRSMQEELEYRLTNLDSTNITSINTDDTKMEGNSIQGIAELSKTVGDLSQDYSTLRVSMNGLATTVSSQGQSISTLEHTGGSLPSLRTPQQPHEKHPNQ